MQHEKMIEMNERVDQMTHRMPKLLLAVATGFFVLAAFSTAAIASNFSIAPFTFQGKTKQYTFYAPTISGYTFKGSLDYNPDAVTATGPERQLRYGIPEGYMLGYDNFNDMESRCPRVFFTHDNYLRSYTGDGGSKASVIDRGSLARTRGDIKHEKPCLPVGYIHPTV